MQRLFDFVRRRPRRPSFEPLGEERRDVALTLEDVESWSASLETLLGSTEGLEEFRIFLRGKGLEDYLQFYLAVEMLKKKSDCEEISIICSNIYDRYIDYDIFGCRIPISEPTIKEIRDGLKNATASLYNDAQEITFRYLQNKSYPAFLGSDQYRNLLEFYQ